MTRYQKMSAIQHCYVVLNAGKRLRRHDFCGNNSLRSGCSEATGRITDAESVDCQSTGRAPSTEAFGVGLAWAEYDDR